MTRYNIELRTNTTVRETLPVEAQDLTALRVEVARFVGCVLREHAAQIWIDEDWRVDATDERGLILFVMNISATNSAATMPMRR